MPNTGRFIWNILEVEQPQGSPIPGSPFNIPLDATAQDIVEITDGVLTESQAQSYIDSRIVEPGEDPIAEQCSPACLTNLQPSEYPAEIVRGQTVGESWHAQVGSNIVCVTHIKF